MNTKSKGARRERQARRILETAGYHAVKAGGSLGIFDLVALGPARARLIQVKSNEKPRPADRERLDLFPSLPYASKELWVFHDRQREPTIEGAGMSELKRWFGHGGRTIGHDSES